MVRIVCFLRGEVCNADTGFFSDNACEVGDLQGIVPDSSWCVVQMKLGFVQSHEMIYSVPFSAGPSRSVAYVVAFQV